MNGTCTYCNQPCNIITVDFGIGLNEYWGSVTNDVQLAVVSDCCNAEAIDDNGDDISLATLKKDNDAAKAEAYEYYRD